MFTSRRAAALTTASAIVLALAPLTSAQAVTATTSLFIIRAAETPVTDEVPTSIPIVNGVNGGTIGTGTDYYGRLGLHARRSTPDFGSQSAFLSVPRKAAVGTYPLVSGGDASTFEYGGGNCGTGDGTVVVRDAAWNADGSPIRLSITLSLPCGSNGNSGRAGSTSVEIRYNMPTASALVGAVELTGPHPTVSTVVGTPVDATRTFTNHGTGPAVMGAAAIAWSQMSSYPAFSIKQDGCKGTTLQPQQSCDVVVRFAPQVGSHDRAVLVVPDGRPQPAGADVYGDATPQPDQPVFVATSGQLGSEVVTWTTPVVSTTNREYDGYHVHSVDSAGVIGPVVASTGPNVTRAEITGLSDRTVYGYAVQPVLPGGALGPMSVVVRDSTVGRLLVYSDRTTSAGPRGVRSRGLDPLGNPATRFADDRPVEHMALSPDLGALAFSQHVYVAQGGYNACQLSVLPRTGVAQPTVIPGETETCNTFPSFTSDTTLVFARQDDVTSSAPYLASYDLVSGVVTPVEGGAGLTQPAVAPDGSIVAVDPVGGTLVRLAGGVATAIPNTATGTQPAVSATGRIAFVAGPAYYDQRINVVEADGSAPVVLSPQDDVASAPSWTGATLYFAQDFDIWRVTSGAPENVTVGGNGWEGTPLVIDVPDTTGPAITSRPALPTFISAPTISWTVGATDPGPAGAGVASYDAVVRTGPVGGALGAATSPAGWSGATTPTFTLPVSTGQRYCLSARATDKAGNVGEYSPETCTTVDRTLPVASLSAPTAPFSVASPIALAWSGSDTGGSGLTSYDVRTQKAASSSGFSAWAPVLTRTTARSMSLPGYAGYTSCVSVRATDGAGNVGAWSAPRCTALPVDDRALAASAGWARVGSTAVFARTLTTTTRLNATLVSGNLQTSRLGLVATKCPTCGVVGVYVGSTLLAKVNLASSRTYYKSVIALPRVSLRTTKVTLKVLTSGKSVQIDGLHSSRV